MGAWLLATRGSILTAQVSDRAPAIDTELQVFAIAMATLVYAVAKPELPPLRLSDRFRHDVTYFMTVPGEQGAPKLPPGEYWVRLDEARVWLEDGTLRVVSPLDSENRTELELSEEQEQWLEWMVQHEIEHLRVVAEVEAHRDR